MKSVIFCSCCNWFILTLMSVLHITSVSRAMPQAEVTEKPINTSTYIFVKPGISYNGKSAATNLETSTATVSVLLTIDNWCRWSLTEPEIQVTCGKKQGVVPENIKPGISEMMFFEKGAGFTGVCGVITYRLDMPPDEQPHYLQVMWSVPYDLNTYNAYLAVGIANEFLNSSSLFNELYYHTGPFQRVKAGNLAEYGAADLKVKLRGTMQPDTYKPIISISVMPIEERDSFQYAGQNLASRNIENYIFVLCFTLTYCLFNLYI